MFTICVKNIYNKEDGFVGMWVNTDFIFFKFFVIRRYLKSIFKWVTIEEAKSEALYPIFIKDRLESLPKECWIRKLKISKGYIDLIYYKRYNCN